MKPVFKKIIFVLIINIFLLIFLEGLCSFYMTLRNFMTPVHPVPERHFTKHDSLLGWINIPGIKVKNIYGTNTNLKINSQGFRNSQDFSTKIPKDKIRILCCGDSFTLGHGVDNEHTWCQQLESFDKHLETINMGQAGYGIDQAYLWYMRDGRKFDYNIHIFAFITEDLFRMGSKNFCGYSKPILKLLNRELVVKNIPVPGYSYLFPRLTEASLNLDQFKLYQILRNILRKTRLFKNTSPIINVHNIKAIALKIFENLNQVNKEKGSTLILVHLPEYPTYRIYSGYEWDNSYEWRRWLKTEAIKRGILYVDLYDDFSKLTHRELSSLFIPEDEHYSVKGNQFVADAIYKRLVSLDLISKK